MTEQDGRLAQSYLDPRCSRIIPPYSGLQIMSSIAIAPNVTFSVDPFQNLGGPIQCTGLFSPDRPV